MPDIPPVLVVLLHADVAGSTALVQREETLAHARITEAFRRLASTIKDYGGTVHEIRGDALIAEFSRASDAVCAALAFQRTNTERNAQFDDGITPAMRMGISLGEVVIADQTVTGAGVVLAQRLEQLAAVGGVCIQQAVYETLPRRLPFDYEALGEQQLKGFDEPVRAYSVTARSGAALPAPATRAKARWHIRRVLVTGAIAAVFIVAIGAIAWLAPWAPSVERASVERMAFPLPDKPSIAVLPFENMSADAEQDYFADGMTEDLITDLSKVTGLFVIARNSTFAYKGKSPDIRRVAEALGVRYVLEGSVRRSGDQVRINAQLIDATTGGHIWAERYDGHLNDVFALQDKVTGNITAVLAVQLTTGDQERAARKGTRNAQAYDAFLQGWHHYLRETPEDFREAIPHFKKAVELDPKYGRAYAALAATYWEIWKRYWYESVGLGSPHDARFLAEEFLAKAMQNPTPLAHQVAAGMFAQMGEHGKAIAEADRAIALGPNDADSYIALAGVLSLAGQADRALKLVERAMRLNPHYPPFYLYHLGLAQFGAGQLEQAADSLEEATRLNPDDRWSLRLLLATYGLLKRDVDADKLYQAIQHGEKRGVLSVTHDPLTIRSTEFWYRFKSPADAERLADGLRKAGVPD